MADDCIFCKIVNKEIPSEIVYEDDKILAFEDIQPQAKVHVLVIPKKHIVSLNEISKEDSPLMGYLLTKLKEIALQKGLKDYRVISNCGKAAGQEVFHMHWHLLGGQNLGHLIQK